MSLIKNLIKEPEIKSKPHHKKKKNQTDGEAIDDNDSGEDGEKTVTPRPIVKTATDLHRLKIEKLMKNPDKVVHIPGSKHDKDYMQSVPTFVRNVMGSSAGAGSGEFHVYRHLRRKEYARQKMIQMKSHKELMDEEFQRKLEENKKLAEQKTAKKRAKRLKKKQRKKVRKNNNPSSNSNGNQSQEDNQELTSSSSEEGEEEEEDKEDKKTEEKKTEVNEEKEGDDAKSPAHDEESIAEKSGESQSPTEGATNTIQDPSAAAESSSKTNESESK